MGLPHLFMNNKQDSSVGCAVAWHHPEHNAWTGVRVHMGKKQEAYDAEQHIIYRASYDLAFPEPRGQKTVIFSDAQAGLQRIISDAPGPGQRYALAIAQQGHEPMGATKSLRPFSMGPRPCRHGRQREGRRVGKGGSTERMRLRATALRVQQRVPGPPEARYHRAEVGRDMLTDGVALEQAPRVPTTEEDAARPDKPAKR